MSVITSEYVGFQINLWQVRTTTGPEHFHGPSLAYL